jgi:hypothetical protein
MSAHRLHPALRPVTRWVASRREAVALAIVRDEISFTEALEAHDLSPDELTSWIFGLRRHGREGLYALKPRLRSPTALLSA